MITYTFETGEYGEGYPWRLFVDVTADNKYLQNKKLCCHAKNVVKKSDQDSEWEEGTIPRMIHALNEGSCNCTLVCLDCVLDGMKKIESGEVQGKEEQ
jgi:hypothetical protein